MAKFNLEVEVSDELIAKLKETYQHTYGIDMIDSCLQRYLTDECNALFGSESYLVEKPELHNEDVTYYIMPKKD